MSLSLPCVGGSVVGRQARRAALPTALRTKPLRHVCRVAEKDVITEALMKATTDAGIADLTKQLIESDPEMQEQLQKYRDAMARVDRAKVAAAELDKEYAVAAANAARAEQEEEILRRQKAGELMAAAEVAAAEKLLMAAELEHMTAQEDKQRWSAEMSQTAGRVESGKAAACAVIGGVAGLLPFVLLQGDSAALTGLPALLSLVAAVASCALFGVTYRYAVGSNPQNPHLKGGVVTAFGLVRAAAAADMLQLTSTGGPFSPEVVGTAALYAGQSVLMFAFSATAIEAAFQQGVLKRIDEVPAPPSLGK